ncbi:hypothetical protein [Caballeronia sp. INSB1]|uniref:hypothetical protein n=1 Tax=Caballeronia sp. INSB1 TaxID=2921751 RepID=UPI002032E0E8|nr:hypothetical protein [Caballeronia sp. INSB1]
MTPEDVVGIFEKLNLEGRADIPLDDACAGMAGWLAGAWPRLEDEDVQLLTTIGAVLWREGFAQRRPRR